MSHSPASSLNGFVIPWWSVGLICSKCTYRWVLLKLDFWGHENLSDL